MSWPGDLSDEKLIDALTKASLVQGHGSLFISADAGGEVRRYRACRVELRRRLQLRHDLSKKIIDLIGDGTVSEEDGRISVPEVDINELGELWQLAMSVT